MLPPALICIVIMGPTLEEAKRQILQAVHYADVLELRLDHIDFLTLEDVTALVEFSLFPVVFTLRKTPQMEEEARQQMLKKLVKLKPAYIDLEYDLPLSFFEEIRNEEPEVKIICSYHNLEHTPPDLDSIYLKLKEKPADIYKISAMANSILDSIRMLKWLDANRSEKSIGICMGELGQVTRILGPVYGSCWTYASLEDGLASAPGQLNARTLLKFYRYKTLNSETQVYGLIGDPISQSPSHYTHNIVMGELGVNAVYVKFRVKPDELGSFMNGARLLGWKGFSVTIPHKENVMEYLSVTEADIVKVGAINTLAFTSEGILGMNSDRKGALDVLENKIAVKDKKIVLLGAGGSAKAIAFEAKKRGAHLVILNRTAARAEELATEVNARYGSLDQFPQIANEGYDVLINCTSVGKEGTSPVLAQALLPGRVVMDIIITPKITPLLEAAKEKECSLVYGLEMFLQQASWQFLFWFGDKVKREKIVVTLDKAIAEWQSMQ